MPAWHAFPCRAPTTEIPHKQLQTYVQSLDLGGLLGLTCTGSVFALNNLEHILNILKYKSENCAREGLKIPNSNSRYECDLSGLVDDSGAQPVVRLNISGAGYNRFEVNVTTDPSFQKVIGIEAAGWNMTPVQHGNIRRPDIRNDLILTDSGSCK